MPFDKPIFRMDLVTTKIECIDDKKNLYRFYQKPDPKRYEEKTIEGEKGYFDKFDNVFYPQSVLNKSMPSLKGQTVHYSPPKNNNIHKYILSREKAINSSLDEEIIDDKIESHTQDFLKDFENDSMNFIILSIDITGSTKMSQHLSPELNSKIISLFLKEMTLIVDNFKGNILKYTGDGLIAYFPEPNMLGMTDNALYCASTMRQMIFHGINPILKSRNLPKLNFRIGMDSGKALVKTFGIQGIKIQTDLIGETVNIAVKIQDLAKNNHILVGSSTVKYSHNSWRTKTKKIKLPADWSYSDKSTNQIYEVYRLKE